MPLLGWLLTYRHTTSRWGCFRQTEIDWEPRWANAEPPQNSALVAWYEAYAEAMDTARRTIRHDAGRIRRFLEDAGFIEVRHEIVRCYIGRWSEDGVAEDQTAEDKAEEDPSLWFQSVLPDTLEAISLLPLHSYWEGDVKALCDRAKKEVLNTSGAYMDM
jgi:hypothetical protein